MEFENIAEAREPAAASKPAAPAANWPASKPWVETGHQRGHQNQMKNLFFQWEIDMFPQLQNLWKRNKCQYNLGFALYGFNMFRVPSVLNLIVNLFQRSTLHFYSRSDQFDLNLFLTFIFLYILHCSLKWGKWIQIKQRTILLSAPSPEFIQILRGTFKRTAVCPVW